MSIQFWTIKTQIKYAFSNRKTKKRFSWAVWKAHLKAECIWMLCHTSVITYATKLSPLRSWRWIIFQTVFSPIPDHPYQFHPTTGPTISTLLRRLHHSILTIPTTKDHLSIQWAANHQNCFHHNHHFEIQMPTTRRPNQVWKKSIWSWMKINPEIIWITTTQTHRKTIINQVRSF